MQEIIIFQEFEIKIIRISTDIYFNARDTYRALRQPHDRNSLKRFLGVLDFEYKKSLFELQPSGTMINKTIYFITFPGICHVIMNLKTPQAKHLENYIFHSFLPSLKDVQDETRRRLEKDLETQKFITYELATAKNSLAIKYSILESDFLNLQTAYKKIQADYFESEKRKKDLEEILIPKSSTTGTLKRVKSFFLKK